MHSTEEVQKLFGERVKYFREQRDWSVERLGEKIQKSKASISRLEHGKQNLSMVDIAQLAQVFEVEVETLFRQGEVFALPQAEPTTVRQMASHHGRLQECLTVALEETNALIPYIQRFLAQAP